MNLTISATLLAVIPLASQQGEPGSLLACGSPSQTFESIEEQICAVAVGSPDQASANSNAIDALRLAVPQALNVSCKTCEDPPTATCDMRILFDIAGVVVTPLPPLTPTKFRAQACLPAGQTVTLKCEEC
jgi:hypothetical protein